MATGSNSKLESPTNLADVRFWDNAWERVKLRRFSRLNYFDYRFHLECKAIVRPGDRVLEVGCGGSHWMGYIERELGGEICGIDSSREGLEMVKQDLSPEARSRLVMDDFFAANALAPESFDVIYSLGFIEHFTDPVCVTRRIFDLLKPGGRVLTIIPNFTGFYGWLQKTFGREVYNKHVILDRADLDRIHEEAGFCAVKPGSYFFSFGPLVVNYAAVRDRWKPLSRVVLLFTKLLQQAVNWPLWLLHLRFETRTFSPSIICVYRKPME